MRDIMRLLFGDGQGADGSADSWDRRGRRPRVEDSREWCGTGPGDEAINQVAAVLRGRGRGRAHPRHVVVKGRKPGLGDRF
jgi:hypothetical protein